MTSGSQVINHHNRLFNLFKRDNQKALAAFFAFSTRSPPRSRATRPLCVHGGVSVARLAPLNWTDVYSPELTTTDHVRHQQTVSEPSIPPQPPPRSPRCTKTRLQRTPTTHSTPQTTCPPKFSPSAPFPTQKSKITHSWHNPELLIPPGGRRSGSVGGLPVR